MKCYNSFGEMFDAQRGQSDRSVFNGIAQTKLSWRDVAGHNVVVPVRLSTEDPTKDVTWLYSKDGATFMPIDSASKDIQDAFHKALDETESDFLDRVSAQTKKDPKFNSTNISDDTLAKYLNAITELNGGKCVWSGIGSIKTSTKDKEDINVVVSTGILKLNDGNTGNKKNEYIRYGFDKGVPYIERFDSKEKSLGRFSEAEMQSLLGKPYYEGAKKDPEEYSKDDNNAWDVIAKGLESKYMSTGKFKIPEVHFVKGEVDFKDMEKELNDSIGPREKDKADREATLKANFDRWDQEEFDKKSTIGQAAIRAKKGLAKVAEKTGIKKFFYGS